MASDTSYALSLLELAESAPRSAPLHLQEIERLYLATDWRIVLLDPRICSTYGTLPPVAMFKALVLPFLLNIESEHILARELAERETLRILCGFSAGKTPTRSMLWHFRHTPPGLYPDLMIKVLIAVVLNGQRPNMDLPFVLPISPEAEEPQGEYTSFSIDAYRPQVELWTSASRLNAYKIETSGKTFLELSHELNNPAYQRPRQNISSELPLPVEVRTQLHNGRFVRFALDMPHWFRHPVGRVTHSKDPLTTISSSSHTPYVACNILVIRQHEGTWQVLMCRRLAGYGKGQFGLPGGKVRPGESMADCSARELFEETNLHLIRSRPISIRRNRLPGQPPVFSIGVEVQEFSGVLRHREPNQNTHWEWFELDKPPAPLFEPAKIALEDFKAKRFPALEWSDVEVQLRDKTILHNQLALELQTTG